MEIFWIALVFGWVSLMLRSSGEGFMRKIPKPPEHLRTKEKPKKARKYVERKSTN